MDDGQKLHSPSFSSLAALRIFLFYLLAWNGISTSSINFIREIKFLQKIIGMKQFCQKRTDEIFLHGLFGIENNLNKNKGNYDNRYYNRKFSLQNWHSVIGGRWSIIYHGLLLSPFSLDSHPHTSLLFPPLLYSHPHTAQQLLF